MKLIPLVLVALFAGACAVGTAAPAAQSVAGGAISPELGATSQVRGVAVGAPSLAATADKAAVPPGGAPGQNVPVPLAFDPDRSIILSANVSLRATDPWAIADRAQGVAIGLGGDILSMSQSGNGDQRSALLTLRVPSARFNDALRQIRTLDAEVLSSNVTSQDVTDQFVDLQARLSAKQTEEQRYLALLARANTIDEILKINVQLSQVRTQIEQMTGQINSFKARTQYSAIAVNIGTGGVVTPPVPGTWNPAKTFGFAFAALLSLLHGVADLAIWLAVLGGIPLLVAGLAALVLARRRTPATTA